MERFFLFSLFLYLLGALLGIGSSRAESRYSQAISRVAYLAATGFTAWIFVSRMMLAGEWVITGFFDGILFSLLLIGVMYCVAAIRMPSTIAPAALSLLSLILGVLALFRLDADAEQFAGVTPEIGMPALVLGSHTYCMFVALAMLSLSFIFSVLFLTEDYLLKRHRAGAVNAGIPPLELTGRLNFFSLALGASALAVGVLGGVALSQYRGQGTWADPAVWLSFLMLAAYVALVLIRVGPLERARTVAFTSIVCYALLILVYLAAHQ